MVEQALSAPRLSTLSKTGATRLLFALGVVLLLAFPSLGFGEFTTTLVTEALILGIWAMSLDLLVGFTGLVTFGHTAGFGLGAYAAGYFAQHVTSEFTLVLLVAEVVVISVAVIAGFIVSRISGVAFAIVTLAISQVLLQIGVAWVPVTGGMDGLIGVPLPKLFGRTVESGESFYLMVAVFLILIYLALLRLTNSPFGRTLQAIRLSEHRSAAIGINVHLHKWVVFVISWTVAGIAGTLLVFMKAGTTPLVFNWYESGYILVVTIFGGLGTLLGPAIGAVIVTLARDQLITLLQAWQLVFGLAFVLAVIFFPAGLAGVGVRIWSHLWKTRC
jgi:branched-chain amino acid transport system permease protein